MSDTRHKDANWTVRANPDNTVGWDGVHAAILMDIRDELKSLNRLLHCENFIAIPHILRGVRRNTAKPRKKPRRAK